MTSKFGGVAVAPAAPTAAAPGVTTSKFGGVPVNDNATSAAPPQSFQPSYGEELLNDYISEPEGAFDTLKNDWVASQGGTADQKKQWANAGFWDQMKGQFHQTVAAGKLPLDAFNVLISPVTGLIRAGVANPSAHAMRALTHAVLPGSEAMENKPGENKPGKLPNQEQTEDSVMTALSAVGPAKGANLAVAASSKPPSTFSHLFSLDSIGVKSPKEWAQRYVGRALKRDSVTPEEAAAKVSKPGSALIDVGKESMVEAGEQGALKGEGRRLGAALYYDDRLKGRRGRVAKAVDKLSNDKNMYEHLDEQNQKRQTEAAPLYEEAYSAVKPIKDQLEGEFNEASKAVNKHQGDLNAAESGITSAAAKHYAANSLESEGSAYEAENTAKRFRDDAAGNLEEAQQRKADITARMQAAQKLEAAGVKGAMWSPRLQEFLENPKVQEGIRAGVAIEKDLALAENRPFRLMDYAIDGVDKDGNPNVMDVPTLRLLDAGKGGLDQMLEEYRDSTTGKLVLDKRGRAIEKVRRAFVQEIDRLTADNPVYKRAREAWSGPSAVIDAVHKGMKFHQAAPEVLGKYAEGLSEAEREGHQIGATRNIAEKVAEGPAASLRVAKDIVNDDYYQRQLRAVFGEEKFNQLLELAHNEVSYAERGSQVLAGSPTARRGEAAKEFESVGDIGDELITAARGGLSGVLVGGKRMLSRLATGWMVDALRGLSDARREELGKLLFSTDKDDNLKAIEEIYKLQAGQGATTPRIPKRKYLPQAAAAANQQQDQPQQ